MQDVRRLRLFVSMYDSSDLANDGGISRSVLWQVYALTKVGQRGASTVWGFDPVAENMTSGAGSPLAKIYVPNGVTSEIKEAGYKDFWAAIYALRDLKLVEFVPHVFESDQPESEMIHPYAVDAGEPWELRLSLAAHEAGRKCLSPGQQQWAEEQSRLLLPVRSHIDKLAVIGIARLKYRPQTKMTAAWYAKSKEKAEVFTPIYEEISRDVIAPSDSASAR
jgi:hypothetical protein